MTKSSTRPWKKVLATTPTNTENSLVSLYDLFYDSKTDKLWVESENTTAGCSLEHDIICLNSAMLKSDNSIDLTSAPDIRSADWWRNGIDISLPIYDARARSKEITCNASIPVTVVGGTTSEDDIFPGRKFTLYDKDSALEPSSTDVFTSRGVMYNFAGNTVTSANYLPPSIAPFVPGVDNQADILLSSPDVAFKSTLVTRDGFSAYNKIMVNPYTWFGVCLVVKATGMKYQSLLGIGANDFKNASPTTMVFRDYKDFWDTRDSENLCIAKAIISGRLATEHIDETSENYSGDRWRTLLKNTFVWVRAPFYADYIKPDSFEQDLTPDSKVVHNELMLSGAGDFKKYDMYSMSSSAVTNHHYPDVPNNVNLPGVGLSDRNSSDTDLKLVGMSELSMPYIPKTSPTVDIYTSKMLDAQLSGIKMTQSPTEQIDTSNYSSRLKMPETGTPIDDFIENKLSNNGNSIVRSLPVAAINRGGMVDTNYNVGSNSLIPPNWFDPESRMDDDYYRRMGKFPSVLPSDGNLYVDGRIIGPTIDEIWIMLKKITGGRSSDVNFEDHNVNRAETLDLGLPRGTGHYENDTDTKMSEVPDAEFNFDMGPDNNKHNKHGDPIDFKFEYDNNAESFNLYNQKLSVTKFVNQNNGITYPLYGSLRRLSDDIISLTKNHEGKCDIQKESGEPETLRRDIENFTAWADVTEASTSDEKVEHKETVTSDSEDNEKKAWAPRRIPYSIRELEAMIMGNKYNLITQSRFIKENFAVTGGLGKVTGEVVKEGGLKDLSNFTSGSLYQMHRNYNFDVTNPNTFYNNGGTNTGFDGAGEACGAKATIDDEDWRSLEQKMNGHIRYVENYGTSPALSEDPEKYSSSDVYLSAFGDWRYVSDHNRIPILRGEWI